MHSSTAGHHTAAQRLHGASTQMKCIGGPRMAALQWPGLDLAEGDEAAEPGARQQQQPDRRRRLHQQRATGFCIVQWPLWPRGI
jgi:hypothetical protein